MRNEIAIPEKTATRIRKNLDMVERQQVALNNFIEGVAAGLEVPEGYKLDVDRMVWCAPGETTATLYDGGVEASEVTDGGLE